MQRPWFPHPVEAGRGDREDRRQSSRLHENVVSTLNLINGPVVLRLRTCVGGLTQPRYKGVAVKAQDRFGAAMSQIC